MKDRRRHDEPADPQRVVRDFLAAGKQAFEEARFEEAASTLQAALDLCERMRDTDHLALEVMEALVIALRRGGRAAEALAMQRRVVAFNEAARPEDPRFFAALTALAILCDGAGRAEEAKAIIERVIAAIEAGDEEDPSKIAQAGAFGQVLLQRGEHLDAAERLLRRALRGLTEALGEDEPEAADVAVALADLLVRTDRDEEAWTLLEEAVPTLEAEQTPRARLGLGLMHLGRSRLSGERYDDAESLFTRAEAVYRAVAGPGSAEALGCRFQRALTYRERGKREQAEALFAQVLRDAEATFGPTHPAVANVAEGYAELLEDMGRDEEAAVLQERVEAIREDDEDEEG